MCFIQFPKRKVCIKWKDAGLLGGDSCKTTTMNKISTTVITTNYSCANHSCVDRRSDLTGTGRDLMKGKMRLLNIWLRRHAKLYKYTRCQESFSQQQFSSVRILLCTRVVCPFWKESIWTNVQIFSVAKLTRFLSHCVQHNYVAPAWNPAESVRKYGLECGCIVSLGFPVTDSERITWNGSVVPPKLTVLHGPYLVAIHACSVEAWTADRHRIGPLHCLLNCRWVDSSQVVLIFHVFSCRTWPWLPSFSETLLQLEISFWWQVLHMGLLIQMFRFHFVSKKFSAIRLTFHVFGRTAGLTGHHLRTVVGMFRCFDFLRLR